MRTFIRRNTLLLLLLATVFNTGLLLYSLTHANYVQKETDSKISIKVQPEKNELLVMFRKGLAEAQSENNAEEGLALVETAMTQGLDEPRCFQDFWGIYQEYLRNADFDNTKKIAALDFFIECTQSAIKSCKALPDFQVVWEIVAKASTMREQIIHNECQLAYELLTASDHAPYIKIFTGPDDVPSTSISLAFATLQQYSENLTDEQKQCVSTVTKTACNSFLAEITALETRIKDLSDPANIPHSPSFDSKEQKYTIGPTYQLMTDIQTLIQKYANSEALTLFQQEMPTEIEHCDMTELAEKAVRLNQICYNLWANYEIHASDSLHATTRQRRLSKIAAEFLIPEVAAAYSSVQAKDLEELKTNNNTQELSTVLRSIILAERVPLSAF